MKKFQFTLQKLMDFRQQELDRQKNTLSALQAELFVNALAHAVKRAIPRQLSKQRRGGILRLLGIKNRTKTETALQRLRKQFDPLKAEKTGGAAPFFIVQLCRANNRLVLSAG